VALSGAPDRAASRTADAVPSRGAAAADFLTDMFSIVTQSQLALDGNYDRVCCLKHVGTEGNSTGNDANNGTSAASPWKKLNRVSDASFVPGDVILFKRGDVWSGPTDGLLAPCKNTSCSGTLAAPILISAYGTGALPLINTNGAAEQ